MKIGVLLKRPIFDIHYFSFDKILFINLINVK